MTHRTHYRAAIAAGLLYACAGVPSRAPLGGSYALPESAPANDRHALAATSTAAREAAPPEPVRALPAASAPSATAGASGATAVVAADALRFEPFSAGALIKAEVTLSAAAEMRGGPAGMPANMKLSFETRQRVELKVLRVSARGFDELELTLTTLSARSEFGSVTSNDKPTPAQTYAITLAGSSPSIRKANGAKVEPDECFNVAIAVVPLAEFVARWAPSPTLALEPGWQSQVPLPLAATLCSADPGQTMRVGPLNARFDSRAPASSEVPFELTLPVTYGGKLGKIQVDLSGSAKLTANSGRPLSLDMSGPLSASGGSRGPSMSITGTAKLGATLSYR